jgi:hypothetical protein
MAHKRSLVDIDFNHLYNTTNFTHPTIINNRINHTFVTLASGFAILSRLNLNLLDFQRSIIPPNTSRSVWEQGRNNGKTFSFRSIFDFSMFHKIDTDIVVFGAKFLTRYIFSHADVKSPFD